MFRRLVRSSRISTESFHVLKLNDVDALHPVLVSVRQTMSTSEEKKEKEGESEVHFRYLKHRRQISTPSR